VLACTLSVPLSPHSPPSSPSVGVSVILFPLSLSLIPMLPIYLRLYFPTPAVLIHVLYNMYIKYSVTYVLSLSLSLTHVLTHTHTHTHTPVSSLFQNTVHNHY